MLKPPDFTLFLKSIRKLIGTIMFSKLEKLRVYKKKLTFKLVEFVAICSYSVQLFSDTFCTEDQHTKFCCYSVSFNQLKLNYLHKTGYFLVFGFDETRIPLKMVMLPSAVER